MILLAFKNSGNNKKFKKTLMANFSKKSINNQTPLPMSMKLGYNESKTYSIDRTTNFFTIDFFNIKFENKRHAQRFYSI